LNQTFTLLDKIGIGATSKVYKAERIKLKNDNCEKEKNEIIIEKEQTYAVKIARHGHMLENEINILSKIQQNSNVIQMIESGSGFIHKKREHSSKTKFVTYIVFEFAENNELLSYIMDTNKGFGENYGKIIFNKILKGIKHIHSHSVIHRDIKTENMLVTKDFDIKITDFGASSFNQRTKYFDCVGTYGYSGPELFYQILQGYDAYKNDIFSLGVVLFIIVSGFKPFKVAQKMDNLYRHIWKGDYESYWTNIQNKMNGENLSEEFKDLFNRLVCFEPEKRLTISEIETHPWNIINDEDNMGDYIQQMEERKEIVDLQRILMYNKEKEDKIFKTKFVNY